MSNVIDLPVAYDGNTKEVLTYNGNSVPVQLGDVISYLNTCIGHQLADEKDTTFFEFDSMGPLWRENYDLKGFLGSLDSSEIYWRERVFLSGEITLSFDDFPVPENFMDDPIQNWGPYDVDSYVTDWTTYTDKCENKFVARIKNVPSVFAKLQNFRKEVVL